MAGAGCRVAVIAKELHTHTKLAGAGNAVVASLSKIFHFETPHAPSPRHGAAAGAEFGVHRGEEKNPWVKEPLIVVIDWLSRATGKMLHNKVSIHYIKGTGLNDIRDIIILLSPSFGEGYYLTLR